MTERVLVVDDEQTYRDAIAEVLRAEGHRVVEASSGELALGLFRSDPCALVVTDIHMQGMSGLDLLAAVKRDEPEAVVVLMTGHASLETATKALRSGASDYLIKPFEGTGQISGVIRRGLERVRLLRHNRELVERLKQAACELKQANDKLSEMVHRDGLTGLYNQGYFREALGREIARSRRHGGPFSLLFLDIDHFKVYNDEHGHVAGDRLLANLARILVRRCRRSTVVARYGGEEFVLLAPETDRNDGLHFAESIRRCVECQPFPGGETQPLGRVTVSVGLATYPDDGVDCNTLIDRADKAMYRSKADGRNAVSAVEPVGV